MEEFFEDEGVVTVFASNLNEVCIKVEWHFAPGYAAFTPKNARKVADAIRRCADELEAQQHT